MVEKLAERLRALDATPDLPLTEDQQQQLAAATKQYGSCVLVVCVHVHMRVQCGTNTTYNV